MSQILTDTKSTHFELEDVDWDLVVIGGGTAGLVASRTAAGFGAKVLLIERNRLGGECLWTGCVPSKALIAAARAAHRAGPDAALGVRTVTSVDFARVLEHVRSSMLTIAPHDSAESLEADGVTVLLADVRFTSRRSVTTSAGGRIRFRQALIATGSAPRHVHLGGDRVEALTNETIWDIETLPTRLAVIGGGAVACELAQAFARLGSTVTVVQRNAQLLSKESPDAAALIRDALVEDGVDVRCGVTAVEAESHDGRSGTLVLTDGSRVPFDRLVMAVGRSARSAGLGADAAGIELDELGNIAVDAWMRTSNNRVRAAGDVTSLPRFTHTAGVNGSNAATNAVLGLRRRTDSVVPRVTFTDPELAAVGAQADADAPNQVLTVHHRDLDRAIAEGDTAGFTRLVLDTSGIVIGGTIVGPRAGESLAEVTLAVRNRLKAADIAGTTHPYPTYNDGVWNAALIDVRRRLRGGAVRRLIRVLLDARRLTMR